MLPILSPGYLAVSIVAALWAAGLVGYMLAIHRLRKVFIGHLATCSRLQARLDAETGTAALPGWAWADKVGWWRSHPDSVDVRYIVAPSPNRLRGWRLLTIEPSTSEVLSTGPWGLSALDAIEQAERRMGGQPAVTP